MKKRSKSIMIYFLFCVAAVTVFGGTMVSGTSSGTKYALNHACAEESGIVTENGNIFALTSEDETHTHEFVYSKDENGHVGICTICGYKTEVLPHETEYVSDINGHTGTCTVCGYQTGKTPHTYEYEYDEEKHTGICTVCGFETEEEHKLVWITDKEATATEQGYRHQECSICGGKFNENDIIYPPIADGGTVVTIVFAVLLALAAAAIIYTKKKEKKNKKQTENEK